MNLELIKNVSFNFSVRPKTIDAKTIEFEFFKNMIQKDMDVALWINDLSKHFNDVQIYSEHDAELNCFEHIITYKTGCVIDFENNTSEMEILNRCYENFFCIMFAEKARHGIVKTNLLANDFTNYVFEAIELRKCEKEEFEKGLRDLDTKYFGGRYYSQSKKIDPKYLN